MNTILEFAGLTRLTPNNDINGFQLNQLMFTDGGFTLGGNSIEFLSNTTGEFPQLIQNSNFANTVDNDLVFTNDVTYGGAGTGNLSLGGTITGSGSLTVNRELTIAGNYNASGGINLNDANSILRIDGTVSAGDELFISQGQVNALAGTGTINRDVRVASIGQNIGLSGNLTINGTFTADRAQISSGIIIGNGEIVTNGGDSGGSLTVGSGATLAGAGNLITQGLFSGFNIDGTVTGGRTMFINSGGRISGVSGVINAQVEITGGSISSGQNSSIPGAEELTFNDLVTVAGATQISSGLDGASIGSRVIFNSDLRIDSGVTFVQGVVNGSGSIIVANGAEYVLNRALQGPASVVVDGKFTLINNSLSASDLNLNGGVLEFGSGNGLFPNIIGGVARFNGSSTIQGNGATMGYSQFNTDIFLESGTTAIANNVEINGPGLLIIQDGASLVNNGALNVSLLAQGNLDGGAGSTFDGNVILESATASGNLDLNRDLIVRTSSQSTLSAGAFVDVQGITNIESGLLVIENSAILTGDGDLVTSTGAELRVDGLVEKDITIANGALLEGSGQIIGALFIDGMVAPGNSAGLLGIDGDVVLTDTSMTCIEIGGTMAGTSFDQLRGSGMAASSIMIDGILDIMLIEGFRPENSQEFIIIDNFAVSGSYANTSRVFFDQGSFDVEYGTTFVRLFDFQSSAIPEPGSLTFLLVIGVGVIGRRKKRAAI